MSQTCELLITWMQTLTVSITLAFTLSVACNVVLVRMLLELGGRTKKNLLVEKD